MMLNILSPLDKFCPRKTELNEQKLLLLSKTAIKMRLFYYFFEIYNASRLKKDILRFEDDVLY